MKTLGRFPRVIAALIFIAAGVLILIGLYKFGTILGFFLIYPWLLSKILVSVDIDYHLIEIIALLTAAGLYYGVWRGIYRKHPQYGLACIIGLLILQSGFMFFSERNRFYSLSTGQPIKYYTINPLSGEIQVFDRVIYDALGQKARPVDFEISKEIYRQKHAKKYPNEEVPSEKIKNFFDPMTGKPLVYYYQDKDGYHFFLREGYDTKTGLKLTPITSEIVAEQIPKTAQTVPKMIHFRIAFAQKGTRRIVSTLDGLEPIPVEMQCSENGIVVYGYIYNGVAEYQNTGLEQDSSMQFRVRPINNILWHHVSISVLPSYEDKILVIPI